jgi:phosphomevalonate kinase
MKNYYKSKYFFNKKNLFKILAIAQDKCGSGFDISAAVYGTQVYVRFDPAPLLPCLDSTASYDIIFDTATNAEIWNQLTNPFSLPPGLNIVMGDVCGGSSSASMAKEVMSWLKEKPMQSASVWAALAEANKLIFDGFSKLNSLAESKPKEYLDDITKAATLTADKWSLENDDSGVFSLLQNIRKLFKRTRFWLKRMGDNAGVGIEPDSQSALADRTESLPGVLCAGVPGAGGNDAVYALVLSEPAKENVERVWSQWENSMRGKTYGTIVCPLTLSAESKDNSGVLIDKNVQW